MLALIGLFYATVLAVMVVRVIRLHRYMKGQPGREQDFLARHGMEN